MTHENIRLHQEWTLGKPKSEATFAASDGSPFPFECENCGHKPTPQEVLNHHGDCDKCGDTVITYTVDAAECIVRLMANDAISKPIADKPL